MMKITLTARNRDAACDAIRNCDDGYVVEIKKPGRNLDQNAALHAILTDIASKIRHSVRRKAALNDGVEGFDGFRSRNSQR